MTRCFVANAAVSGGGVTFELTVTADRLNGKTRRVAPGLADLIHYVNCSGMSETHLLCGGKFDLLWMVGCGWVLHRLGGLTTNQEAAKKADSFAALRNDKQGRWGVGVGSKVSPSQRSRRT